MPAFPYCHSRLLPVLELDFRIRTPATRDWLPDYTTLPRYSSGLLSNSGNNIERSSYQNTDKMFTLTQLTLVALSLLQIVTSSTQPSDHLNTDHLARATPQWSISCAWGDKFLTQDHKDHMLQCGTEADPKKWFSWDICRNCCKCNGNKMACSSADKENCGYDFGCKDSIVEDFCTGLMPDEEVGFHYTGIEVGCVCRLDGDRKTI
jgi:hypothetical protein